MEKQRGVILLGGGLDSITLLAVLRKTMDADVAALFINYGQKAWLGEATSVTYFCNKYGVPIKTLDVPINQIAESAILRGCAANLGNVAALNKLEGRNIIFLSLAATFACSIGAEKVFVGFHQEPYPPPFPDATIAALESFNALLKVSHDGKVRVTAPLAHMTRQQIVSLGGALDVDILNRSFTCYESQTLKECGECAHCRLKNEMLKEWGREQVVRDSPSGN